MLKIARQRQIYDHLVCSELIEFLQTQTKNCDLAVAADVFVYLGDLRGVFERVRRALRDGGLLPFRSR
jgi:predicted TPR repeat methyltransferase